MIHGRIREKRIRCQLRAAISMKCQPQAKKVRMHFFTNDCQNNCVITNKMFVAFSRRNIVRFRQSGVAPQPKSVEERKNGAIKQNHQQAGWCIVCRKKLVLVTYQLVNRTRYTFYCNNGQHTIIFFEPIFVPNPVGYQLSATTPFLGTHRQ